MAIFLFDFDGVISDSLSMEINYFLPICKARGITGLSTPQDLMVLGTGNWFEKLGELGVSAEEYDAAYHEFYEVVEKLGVQAEPFPQVIELLKEIAPKAALYIVTSNIFAFPNAMFQRWGVEGIRGIHGCEVNPSKVEKINYFKEKYPAEEICFITDTSGDIAEARQSLADVIIAVTWGWHERKMLEEAGPDMIFDEVSELGALIRSKLAQSSDSRS